MVNMGSGDAVSGDDEEWVFLAASGRAEHVLHLPTDSLFNFDEIKT